MFKKKKLLILDNEMFLFFCILVNKVSKVVNVTRTVYQISD